MKKKGFTLIELIVVLAILAILMAIAVPTAFGSIEQARDRAAVASVKGIASTVNVTRGLAILDENLQKETSKDQLAILYYKDGALEKSGNTSNIYEQFYFDSIKKSNLQISAKAFFSIHINENASKNVNLVMVTYSEKGYVKSGALAKPNYPYFTYNNENEEIRKYKAGNDYVVIG